MNDLDIFGSEVVLLMYYRRVTVALNIRVFGDKRSTNICQTKIMSQFIPSKD